MNRVAKAKHALVSYLAFGSATQLPAVVFSPDRERLLRWMDEAGLTLYFADHCERNEHAPSLPSEWSSALSDRRRKNNLRVRAMLAGFRSAVEVLTSADVNFAVLKGFSLQPEFCPNIELRHHIDLDLLVAREDIKHAVIALSSLGYAVEGMEAFGEVRLIKGEPKSPACAQDDIYALRDESKIELHSQLFESRHSAPLNLPDEWQSGVRYKTVNGITFPTISLADAFTLHVLHAFQHMTTGWFRLAWLYEISTFIRLHWHDEELWRQVTARLAEDARSAHAAGLMLLQTHSLFGGELPNVLRRDLVDSMPEYLTRWGGMYGARGAMCDFHSQSKYFQFIHGRFFRSAEQHRRFMLGVWKTRANLFFRYVPHPKLLTRAAFREIDSCAHWVVWRVRQHLSRWQEVQ